MRSRYSAVLICLCVTIARANNAGQEQGNSHQQPLFTPFCRLAGTNQENPKSKGNELPELRNAQVALVQEAATTTQPLQIVKVRGIEGYIWLDGRGNAAWLGTKKESNEDIEIPTLQELPPIKSLRLHGAADSQLLSFANCEKLVAIDLANSRPTDSGFKVFKSYAMLQECTLRYSREAASVTDKGLAFICEATALRHLHLEKTEITDEGLAALERMTNLKHLCIRSRLVKGGGLRHLLPLSSLEYLEIGAPGFWRQGVKNEVRSVNDEHVAQFDQGLHHLRDMENIKFLNLSGSALTDAGMRCMSHMQNLEELNINWTSVSDIGLIQLHGLDRLRIVRVHATAVTSRGAEALRESHRAIKVYGLKREELGADSPLKGSAKD